MMLGQATIPHSCGHVCWWTCGDGAPITWLRFVQTMYEPPCPWCGGEGGAPASPDATEILFHSGPEGLGTLTARREP